MFLPNVNRAFKHHSSRFCEGYDCIASWEIGLQEKWRNVTRFVVNEDVLFTRALLRYYRSRGRRFCFQLVSLSYVIFFATIKIPTTQFSSSLFLAFRHRFSSLRDEKNQNIFFAKIFRFFIKVFAALTYGSIQLRKLSSDTTELGLEDILQRI